jgi:hypothetical protein
MRDARAHLARTDDTDRPDSRAHCYPAGLVPIFVAVQPKANPGKVESGFSVGFARAEAGAGGAIRQFPNTLPTAVLSTRLQQSRPE